MRLPILAAALALGLASHAALAQTPAPQPGTPPSQQDMIRMVHQAAHNQLGILQYCQGQGSVGEDTVALQQRALSMLPPAQVEGLDEAEAAGKRGVVQFGGSEVQLANAAKAQNTTVDAMCKQIATLLQSQASQLPQ